VGPANGQTETAWPDHGAIARRAYELFEKRQHAHGRDLEDWLEAEAELASARSAPARTARTRKQA
jgi:hypothetical protein